MFFLNEYFAIINCFACLLTIVIFIATISFKIDLLKSLTFITLIVPSGGRLGISF